MAHGRRKKDRKPKPRSHMPPPERVIPDAKKEASRRACRGPVGDDEDPVKGEAPEGDQKE